MPDGVYAIGGFDGEKYIETVERYDIMENKWEFVGSLSSPKCTISAVSSADFKSMYVMGGFNR